MENIFKDTHYGRLYKTRDDRIAVYDEYVNGFHLLRINNKELHSYYDNGQAYFGEGDMPFDIVSDYTSTLENDACSINPYNPHEGNSFDAFNEGFMKGFYKAKDISI